METISDYTIHCTEEQTMKALELGASIEEFCGLCPTVSINGIIYDIPTTEQMRGWLEEQGLYIFTEPQPYNGKRLWIGKILNINHPSNYHSYGCLFWEEFDSRREATLAAIDAALKHLIQNKK